MASLRKFVPPVFIVAAVNFSLIMAALPGMLFPKDTERREVKDLSGLWDFRADMSENRNGGFEKMWFAKPLWQVSSHLFKIRNLFFLMLGCILRKEGVVL